MLDTEGKAIPGLYAAGNVIAAVSGTTYPISSCMVFSRLAALDMATRKSH